MYDPEGTQAWDIRQLLGWIEKLGPEHIVLASDFGQAANPKPVDAWLRVGEALLDMGLPEKDLRRMVRDNPTYLLNLTPEEDTMVYEKDDPRSSLATATAARPDSGDAIAAAQYFDLRDNPGRACAERHPGPHAKRRTGTISTTGPWKASWRSWSPAPPRRSRCSPTTARRRSTNPGSSSSHPARRGSACTATAR